MMRRGGALCACVVALLSIGCSATTRHKVLTLFFDGVPEPRQEVAPALSPTAQPQIAPPRQVGYQEHGPYAARLCNACHEAGATNALVAPRDQLCFRCHEFPQDPRYVHGPVVSGGCLVCHDPHSSQYRALLVSESDRFCFRCHDPASVERIEGHADFAEDCTTCHDAHGSDNKYLLK